MSEQPSLSIQLNDEEIDILENDYVRCGFVFIFYLVHCLFICLFYLQIDNPLIIIVPCLV